jgi:copper(I)-binding protein
MQWMPALIAYLGLSLALACSPGAAQSSKADLTIDRPWARAAIKGSTGALYLTISNSSGNDDRLVSVTSDVAKSAQVHETKVNPDGTMEMLALDVLPIPAHARVELKPGGLHVMLTDLQKTLQYRSKFSAVFRFERAGLLQIEVSVERPGAKQPDDVAGMKM